MGNCGPPLQRTKLEAAASNEPDDDSKYIDDAFTESAYEKQNDRAITKYMKSQQRKDSEIMKILLLGAGSSGKSTLFRQIEAIHGEDDMDDTITNTDRFFATIDSLKRTIRYNCMSATLKLLHKSETLSQKPYNLGECKVDCNDENIINAVNVLMPVVRKMNLAKEEISAEVFRRCGEAMDFVWNLKGIKATFKWRQYFSLMENIDFFLDKIHVIMDESKDNEYLPTMEDILNARHQTTGIIEKSYMIQKVRFDIFDVGGQRNERRKWIKLFDKVNGLIYVAALNHYCCVLFEDETINAMKESLRLFDEIVNGKWFASKHTQFIMFLNKNDLFVQRMKEDKIPLSICFKDEYKGPNYSDKSEDASLSKKDKDKWFDKCYRESLEFIKQKYLSRNRNPRVTRILVHVTTATEKSNIQQVFDDVRLGIISQSLATSGFAVNGEMGARF